MAEEIILDIRYDSRQAQADLDALNGKITTLTQSIEGEKVAQAQLKAALEEGKISQVEYSAEMEKSKATLAGLNGERKAAINVMNAEKGSINGLKAEIKALEQQNGKLNPKIKEQKEQMEANNKKIAEYKQTIKDAGGETNKTQGFMGRLTGAVKGGIAQFALMAGAITGAVAGLVKFGKRLIDSSQVLGDQWEIAMQQAKAVTNTFFKALATGDWNGFIDRAKAAAAAAREFAMEIDTLNDLNRSLAVEESKVRLEYVKLETQLKNVNLTNAERLAIGEKMKVLEEGLVKKRVEYTEREYNATIKNISAQTNLSAAQLERYVSEYESLEDIMDIGGKYTELQKELDTLQQRRAQNYNVSSKEEKERIKEITSELGNMTGGQKAAVEVVRAYGSANDEEFNKLKDLMVKRNQVQIDSIKGMQRAETMLNSLTKAESKASGSKIKNIETEEQRREKAQKKQIDDLKYSLEIGNITQAEYYVKLAEYRDANFQAESDQYMALNLEIKKYYDAQEELERQRLEKEQERRDAALATLEEFNQEKLLKEAEQLGTERALREEMALAEYEAKKENDLLIEEEKLVAKAEYEAAMDAIAQEYHDKEIERQREQVESALESLDIILQAAGVFTDQRIQFNNDLLKSITLLSNEEILTNQDKYAILGSLAQSFTSLVLTGTQAQLDDLMRAKESELALAGNNELAREEIEKKYAKKAAELKRKQFNEDKAKAIIDTIIQTAIAVTKSLPNATLAAAVGIAGAAQTAIIASQKPPTISSDSIYELGGEIKTGIFGGLPHSLGGTNIYDQYGNHLANVEKNERFVVMKKEASTMANILSAINQDYGGRSLAQNTNYAQDGGQIDTRQVNIDLRTALEGKIVVRIEDILTGIENRQEVINAGII